MPLRQGEVVLVPFPFTDLSTARQRPAVVVSAGWYNAQKDDCILAAVTTVIRNEQDEVLVQGAEVGPAGLRSESAVRAGKLFTIQRSLIRRSLGTLSQGTLTRVLSEVRAVFQD